MSSKETSQKGSALNLSDVLEAALSSIGDAVIVTDEEGHATFLNQVAEAMTGWTNEQAHGEPISRVFHIVNERTRKRVENPVDKVLATGLIQGLANHTVLLAKDGREVPIDDSGAPVKTRDGRVIGVVLVFRDITERRREELRGAWLTSIVESSEDAIISKSIDGRIASWNQAAERLLGYKASEIVGHSIMTIIPPELHDEEPGIQGRLRRGERIEHFDTVRLTKDGRRIDVSLTISPLKNAEGEVVGASKIMRDVRERKELERRLLEESRLKDEFLAMLAHELRNPMAPIGSAGELLARMLPPESPAQPVIDIIKRQVTQLSRLVDDLLDVSRITQRAIQLRRKPVDLADVVTQAVESVGPQLREKQHTLTTTAEHYEPLYVEGDLARLVQCVANLLSNAIKYTARSGKITVRTRANGHDACIEISDNGIGIAPELLPRVFDLFVQGERTLDRTQGGLGIGLALVKRLVDMHGGHISAQSRGLGQGAAFEVRLPRIERPAAASPVAASFKAAPRRVLIVDDNADAADSLAMLLKFHGHESRVVYSANEALASIESFKPDVALLDIGLPEMDGYQLAKRLRAMPQLKDLRLIAVTGYGQAEDHGRTHAAGFDDHLIKPVDLPSLERAMAAVSHAGGVASGSHGGKT